MTCTLIHGDCIQVMQDLIDDGVKVDLVLTDLPYGITNCKECGSVSDFDVPDMISFDEIASADFKGQLEGHTVYFYGKCENCCKTVLSS